MNRGPGMTARVGKSVTDEALRPQAAQKRRRWPEATRIRDSLFLKVYLTLLACLAAVAVASAAYWSASSEQDGSSWRNRFQTFVERVVPASDSQADLQKMVDRLGHAIDGRLALYGRDGSLVAAHGTPAPKLDDDDDDDEHGAPRWGNFSDSFVMRLDDGRTLVAELDEPVDRDGPGVLGYLLLIAGVVGLAAYPVVRHLTRRLERLKTGVEQFGGGALTARVSVEGKDEIAAVASSFNAAAEQIERLVTSHRSLLANASHELRSPLARLRMAVDLYDGSDARQGAEIIENLNEIDELVEEILLASRLNHVGSLEEAETLDLTAIAAEECARHDIQIFGARVEVKGNRRLLKRLVRNLALNALKHGKPPVEVEVSSDARMARLVVRDHGAGIPAGEEHRVFEAFYRPAGRSESAGGWGLGLALVKQIAELHGGDVRCENAEGGGARFAVNIPKGG
jgi:two-component system OmpR family sensor kinase